jgi:hypothetical protein
VTFDCQIGAQVRPQGLRPAGALGPSTSDVFGTKVTERRRTRRPSPPQHKVEHDEKNEDFVAEVGSQDSYDSCKQQNNNRAQNKDGDFHVEPRPLINAKSSLPIRRQLGVAHLVLDVAVAQVSQQCPRKF